MSLPIALADALRIIHAAGVDDQVVVRGGAPADQRAWIRLDIRLGWAAGRDHEEQLKVLRRIAEELAGAREVVEPVGYCDMFTILAATASADWKLCALPMRRRDEPADASHIAPVVLAVAS